MIGPEEARRRGLGAARGLIVGAALGLALWAVIVAVTFLLAIVVGSVL